MNRRQVVTAIALGSVAAFAGGTYFYTDAVRKAAAELAVQQSEAMIRPHSPVLGAADAKVTIVEFLDPSCEACRAFYPYVKQIMDLYPGEVRLVVRYAAFHDGSDEAVKIIEASRLQGKHIEALEALFAAQPEWAKHDGPDMERAWQAAAAAGVDLARARTDAESAGIGDILRQDAADVQALQIQGTPSFFVNQRPLTETDPRVLYDLVTEEVMKAREAA